MNRNDMLKTYIGFASQRGSRADMASHSMVQSRNWWTSLSADDIANLESDLKSKWSIRFFNPGIFASAVAGIIGVWFLLAVPLIAPTMASGSLFAWAMLFWAFLFTGIAGFLAGVMLFLLAIAMTGYFKKHHALIGLKPLRQTPEKCVMALKSIENCSEARSHRDLVVANGRELLELDLWIVNSLDASQKQLEDDARLEQSCRALHGIGDSPSMAH